MTEKLIRQYLKETKKGVACSAKRKRAFLAQLEAGLRELAQETDDLTMEQLTEAFGTPQQQAQSFMETLDAKEVKKAFGWKKVVLVAVIAMILIWLVAVVTLWIAGHHNLNGHTVDEIIDVPQESIVITTNNNKDNGDSDYGIMTLKDVKELPGSTNAKEGTMEYISYDSDGNKLWSASITASFSYDGTTATCIDVSKSITVYDSSWKCKTADCSKDGETAMGSFTMKRHRFLKPSQSQSCGFTLTCDKDGNIT